MSNKDLNIITQFESTDREEFKRPEHSDFKTSIELRNASYSGIRFNALSNEVEIWVDGVVKGSMPEHEVRHFPEKWDELYGNVFGLYSVKTVQQKGN